MERCYYCKVGHQTHFSKIMHKTGCPQVIRRNEQIYQEGWGDGRTGKPATSNDPAYLMGHQNGICAAEEAVNSWDPRWDE
jgi:hypothetical protein